MKYIIERKRIGDSVAALKVTVFSESSNHCDYADKDKNTEVVGAGTCHIVGSRVAIHGRSESLNKMPHPADATVLAMFFQEMLESQRILLADLYEN